MKQIPCRDLIHAHFLRSWLLSHGIKADVIHECANGLYLPDILPAQVAIDDADVARYETLSTQPDPPLDESFIQPESDEDVPEEKPVSGAATLPTFLEMLVFGAVGGACLAVFTLVVGVLFSLFGNERLLSGEPLPPHLSGQGKLLWELPLLGVIGAIPVYFAIRLADACKARNGQVPWWTRGLALFFLLCLSDIGLILLGVYRMLFWR